MDYGKVKSNRRLSPQSGGKYLYMTYFSHLANVLTPLASWLKEYAGLETVLICYRRDGLPNPGLYHFDESMFAEIVELDPILEGDKSIGLEQIGRLSDAAVEIERQYEFSILELIRTDRHVGIDWVTSVRFPQSEYGRNTDYLQSVDIVVRLVELYKALIKRRPPLAMVGISSAVGPATLWRMLKGLGTQTRALGLARSGPFLFWSQDEYMRPEGFAEAYQEGLAGYKAEGTDNDGGLWLDSSVRARAVLSSVGEPSGWFVLAKELYSMVRKLVANRLFRAGHVYGKYRAIQQISVVVERFIWRRRIRRERSVMESFPSDMPFVFFPLQVEPEATLMLESPMCDNHLTAIDWLSKTVPGGWYVVVKEHPGATTPKTRSFWQTLNKYPNVILAKTLEDARSIAERSRAVAVLNGSLGVQAATIGKPVITFHPKFVARHMPHVLFADSYETTRDALERIRDNILPPMYERIKAAHAFLYALNKCRFSVSDPQILGGVSTREAAFEADVDVIAKTLLASLGVCNSSGGVNAI